MKLSLIFLITTVCLPFSIGYKKEERTFEEDGVVKTVIKEEWETETVVEERTDDRRGRGRGRNRGRGDTETIIIIDENDRDNDNTAVDVQSRPTTIKQKTIAFNRFYNEKLTDYHYSNDEQEQNNLKRDGFKFDGSMGRVVVKREDFSECPDLVPITRLNHPTWASHGLVVNAANVHQWLSSWQWKIDRVIGYGVLENGKCGATKQVRHLGHAPTIQYQTSNDVEYNDKKTKGFFDHVAPAFYIWDENDNFVPPPARPSYHAKTTLLTRIYSEPRLDYHYSIDHQELKTLYQTGFNFDAIMGRVVAKQSDFPDCPDLVPITRLNHPTWTNHGLVVNAANVQQWINSWGWKIDRIIGYGVLQPGKCGANISVRHLGHAPTIQFQTTNDAEYAAYKKIGYNDHVAPTFYIWEA